MAWRDQASDTARLGQGDSPVQLREMAVEKDFGPTTIAEQMSNGGWNKNNMPEGGTLPRESYTIGSRGAESD